MADAKEPELVQDLVVTGKDSLAIPDYLKDEQSAGLDHLGEADIQIPRLLISQGLSPQLDPGKPVYIEDLKQGQMFNSLSGHIYGKGPIYICVVRADPPRWVEFIPRDQGGGVKDPAV